jgi:hypothetical protein
VEVYHYFCPKDAVHDSPLVQFSGVTLVNSAVALVTHPSTAPQHLGIEIPLTECKAAFPDAHEPEEVRKGLTAAIAKERRMGLGADVGFWPMFDFAPTGAWGSAVKPGWGVDTLTANLKMALLSSVSVDGSRARAEQWAEVVQGAKKGAYESLDDTDGAAFEDFGTACNLVQQLGNPFTDNRLENAKELKKLRAELVKAYQGAADHKASSSVYWVMLQYLTAMHYGLEIA